MNFKELHKPYACDDSPNPEGQLKWLIKNGIPQDIATRAMVSVYTEIENGKVISADENHSAGWNLDNYILNVAKKMNYEVTEALLKSIENQEMEQRKKYDSDWYSKSKPRKIWEVLRGVD